jgi:hypothetical protein
MGFDDEKEFKGQSYTGMPVGRSHHWNYPNGDWEETKVTPDLWKIRFRSLKSRQTPAPEGSGVPLNTAYHWFIMADQQVTKTTKDDYQTEMQGLKFKIGHKRPYWKKWSYGCADQLTYRQKLINALQSTLQQLRLEEEYENPTSHVLSQQHTSPLDVSLANPMNPLNPSLSADDIRFHFSLQNLGLRRASVGEPTAEVIV